MRSWEVGIPLSNTISRVKSFVPLPNVLFCKSLYAYRSVFLIKQYSGDQIVKNEMGAVCSTYGGTRGVYRVLVGKPGGKNHLEDPSVDGTII